MERAPAVGTVLGQSRQEPGPALLAGAGRGPAPAGADRRMTRSIMLEVLGEDYIRTARAKGLSEWDVVVRHGLSNGLFPGSR